MVLLQGTEMVYKGFKNEIFALISHNYLGNHSSKIDKNE